MRPEDSRPLSNLSAAYFELGHYEQALEYVATALGKLNCEDRNSTTERKREILENRGRRAQSHKQRFMSKGPHLYELTLLPRYRPSMHSSTEYYTLGHDVMQSLWDPSIIQTYQAEETTALFFAGIGDARNLYATILSIESHEAQTSETAKQKYHFTINDTKPPVIARDLIIFMLLDDLKEVVNFESNAASLVLSTLNYIFHSIIMPRVVLEHLILVINRLIKSLLNQVQPLAWVYIGENDFRPIIKWLRHWKSETAQLYTTPKLIEMVVKQMSMNIQESVWPALEVEETVYLNSAVLYPPRYILTTYEPSLEKLLAESATSKSTLR